jgi:Protein of unknown function (DUF3829)
MEEERVLARVAAGVLSVVGAALGVLWAAYVVSGMFTRTGEVEALVVRLTGGSSMKLSYLLALGPGAALYWLASLPQRRLRARAEAALTLPTAPRPPTARPALGPPPQVLGDEVAGGPVRAVLLLLLVAALAGGLFWYLGGPGRATPAAPEAARPEPEAQGAGDDAEGALDDAVVEAQNRFGQTAATAAEVYDRELGTGAQPRRGDSKYIYPLGSWALQSLDTLGAALAAHPDGGELVGPATAYLAAAKALAVRMEEVERYYGRRTHDQDHWVRGAALHAEVRVAFLTFFSAAEVLAPVARRVGDARRVRLRAVLTASGSLLRLKTMDAVDRGRAVVELLERRRAKGDVKRPALQAALAAYEATVDDLGEMAKDQGRIEREFGASRALFTSVSRQAEFFLRTAREVDGEGPRPTDLDESPEHRDRLVRSFNDLVAATNQLPR